MKYLCLDIGTTCSKTQVFDSNGNILFYSSKECPLMKIDDEYYADIISIQNTVFALIKEATEKIKDINSIAFSSFGESFVLLDKNDNILTYPMLYTDSRGMEQAVKIIDYFSNEELYTITGTMPNAMYSIYKLMYIKENMYDKFIQADKLLLICDYFGYLFTGKRIIDYSLAARTGVFDISKKEFSSGILNKLGIDSKLFSKPMEIGTIVGNIKEDLAKELSLPDTCKLVLGSHDQICATIGAGAIENKQCADGMGTVECITTIFDKKPSNTKAGYQGYPIVPFINGLYCTYIVNLTSNSIMNWYRNDILHNYLEEEKTQFEYLEKQCKNITDLLVLPYFSTASTPYQDSNAKGAIINLTLSTTDGDIYRAIMESTSYEMKFNLEIVREYGIELQSGVVTGGGSNSQMWVQIKSDIFGIPIKTLRSSEGGLCGLAVVSSVAMGESKDYQEGVKVFVKYKKEFIPSNENSEIYTIKYNKYKKLYQNLKELF